jgi:short-subunit dehydrogenase
MTTSNVLATGRTALVTGGSRGIGPHIARELIKHGVNVVLSGRSAADLEAVAKELAKSGASVSIEQADLTQAGAPQALVAAVERKWGGIDLLVNNAGGDPLREFDTMTLEENLRILQLNLIAPLALTHAVLPGMLRRGRGHVVNISAMAGRIAFPYTEAYAAAKDGLIGFTRVLRNDYHKRGVSASVLILGAVRGAGQGQRISDEMNMKVPSFSTVPADAVARAVVKALQNDRVELVVFPGPGRLLRALLDFFPGLGPAISRLGGVSTTMQKVTAHQEAKRNATVPRA